ncbi:hypothetical protein GCM10017752_18770 [Streptomyces roseoviridis]
MSALKAPARAARPESERTGPQPTCARSTFTSRTTSASAAAALLLRERVAAEGEETGVLVAGAPVRRVVRGGSAAGVLVVLVTSGTGFAAGAEEGCAFVAAGSVAAGFGAEGFADGVVGAEGAWALPVPLPAGVPLPVRAGDVEEPPCVVRLGACCASVRCSPVALPPVVNVSPPGSRPAATPIAPTATAAETPSSPVRTGAPRRAPR